MPLRVIEKELVCSECGAPIRREIVPVCMVDRTVSRSDDDDEDELVADEQEMGITTLVEIGPACPRCTGYR